MPKTQNRASSGNGVEIIDIGDLIPDPKNARKHTPRGVGTIVDALHKVGTARSGVIDEKLRLLAGNATFEALAQAGIRRVKVVESNGEEWVVVKRAGLSEKQKRQLALFDNRAAEFSDWDAPILEALKEDDADIFDGLFRDDEWAEMLPKPITEEEQPAETDDGAAAVDRFTVYPMDQVIDEAMRYFRTVGLPFGNMPLHEQMQEVNLLAVTDQDAALNTVRANRVADCYHPGRATCYASGAKHSLMDGFNSDRNLRYAIKMEFFCNAMVKRDYPTLLQVVHDTQVPANFRPGAAMYLYRKYSKPGGIVIDPCAGWGGRLVGWIASRLGGAYYGIDPSPDSYKGNTKLTEALAPQAGINLLNEPFEDVDLKKHKLIEAADFVFTSPPYFNKELYQGEAQACKRYPKFSDWTEKFLKPLLFKSYEALKKGGVCGLNIADIRDPKGKVFPLELLTIQYATMAGFTHSETMSLSISQSKFGSTKNHLTSLIDEGGVSEEFLKEHQIEPVLIFQK